MKTEHVTFLTKSDLTPQELVVVSALLGKFEASLEGIRHVLPDAKDLAMYSEENSEALPLRNFLVKALEEGGLPAEQIEKLYNVATVVAQGMLEDREKEMSRIGREVGYTR